MAELELMGNQCPQKISLVMYKPLQFTLGNGLVLSATYPRGLGLEFHM